jgi:hypothetical protein
VVNPASGSEHQGTEIAPFVQEVGIHATIFEQQFNTGNMTALVGRFLSQRRYHACRDHVAIQTPLQYIRWLGVSNPAEQSVVKLGLCPPLMVKHHLKEQLFGVSRRKIIIQHMVTSRLFVLGVCPAVDVGGKKLCSLLAYLARSRASSKCGMAKPTAGIH